MLATERLPATVGFPVGLPKLGVQAAVGIGGGILLRQFVGRTNATVWALASAMVIVKNLVEDYILKATVAGMGAFPNEYYSTGVSGGEGLGAYPEEVSTPYESF